MSFYNCFVNFVKLQNTYTYLKMVSISIYPNLSLITDETRTELCTNINRLLGSVVFRVLKCDANVYNTLVAIDKLLILFLNLCFVYYNIYENFYKMYE